MTNPNTNCLDGMSCPECESFGPFKMQGMTEFPVDDEGFETFGDVEFQKHHACTCVACGHKATISEFEGGGPVMDPAVEMRQFIESLARMTLPEEGSGQDDTGDAIETLPQVIVRARQLLSLMPGACAAANNFHLLVVEGDVEPVLRGQFPTYEELVAAARGYRQSDDQDLTDGLYGIHIKRGQPEVFPFSGEQLED